VGTIGLVDDGVVDASNLQQIIHTTDRVRCPRVGQDRHPGAEPRRQVNVHPFRVDKDNVLDLIADYDVIVVGPTTSASSTTRRC
jgi:adenylyltransferase/sulfurtransferase